MTPSQKKRIEEIKEKFFQNYCYSNPDNYEIKYTEINERNNYRYQPGGFVTIVIEVGLKGDNGTYAALICRDRGTFHIGRKGGVRNNRWQKCTGKYYKDR